MLKTNVNILKINPWFIIHSSRELMHRVCVQQDDTDESLVVCLHHSAPNSALCQSVAWLDKEFW